jgi:hypothetical protein
MNPGLMLDDDPPIMAKVVTAEVLHSTLPGSRSNQQ